MEDYGLISVIIPVYNSEKYLKECVDSVLAQTYKNYEILLIDDGSIDNSLSICNEYAKADSHVKVFHKENGGASSARNVGLDQALGKYIFFLDSDDYIKEDTFEKMIKTAVDEKVDLVFCEAEAFDDEQGTTLSDHYTYKSKYLSGNPIDIMESMMQNKEFHVAIWMLLLEKSIFDNNNLRFKEGIIYEDMIISYQFYCLANRAAHVNEKLYCRRYRANSVMTSNRTEKNLISAETVYKEVSKFIDTMPKSSVSNRHIVRCAFNYLSIYRSMNRDVKSKHRTNYIDIKKDILSKNAYGDMALKLECKSHILWIVYKAFKKVF